MSNNQDLELTPAQTTAAEAPAQDRRSALRSLTGSAALAGAALLLGSKKAEAAGLLHASWIHGHSGHVELPNNVRRLTPYGFHLELDPYAGQYNWVHFAIPTPVILYDRRLKLWRVMLNFQTASWDSWVHAVHVWDGATPLLRQNGLYLHGNHGFAAFNVPGTPAVQFGIGVSLGIYSGASANDHRFFFRTVGGDFV